jgi:hypothetical protein
MASGSDERFANEIGDFSVSIGGRDSFGTKFRAYEPDSVASPVIARSDQFLLAVKIGDPDGSNRVGFRVHDYGDGSIALQISNGDFLFPDDTNGFVLTFGFGGITTSALPADARFRRIFPSRQITNKLYANEQETKLNVLPEENDH